ncbi:MAG: AAA family ATPase [Candidatus Bipolaricaulia bacterium]
MAPNPSSRAQPLDQRLDSGAETFGQLREGLESVIVGHREAIRGTLIALICNGHVLLEGVPGLGKTMLVKSLGTILGLDFSRIQFTPDLMPADILGTNIISEDEHGHRYFRFSAGPIFANIVLADEINRATPKTQSALLEAMQERGVTVGGETYQLDEPFIVLATQNPIEMEGTYPLPEAQIDRFFFKLVLDYPNLDELDEILERHLTSREGTRSLEQMVDQDAIREARRLVADMPVAAPLRRYITRLINATHPQAEEAPQTVRDYVSYGASPRAAIALLWGAKANAFLDGEPNTRLRDINAVVEPALRHRIIRNFRGEAEGVMVDSILHQVRDAIPEE